MAREPGSRDYRSLKPKSGQKPYEKEKERVGNARRDWWSLEGPTCAEAVASTVLFLQKNQSARMRQQVVSSRLYGNIAMSGAAGAAYTRLMSAASTAVKDRVTYNACQEIIDTLVARVGETKPRPYFLTSGGSYRQQRKAKKLNQFVVGVFYETKTYDVGLDAFRDAAIWGDGFVHVFARGGKICHERVWGSELWVDEIEAQYGYPRNMHRVKVVDKDELAAYFPESRKAIMEASRAPETQSGNTQTSVSDMVTVVESWHLGAPDADGKIVGGKHCITLASSKVMLVEPEEWPYDFFPLARIPWCKRPVGYWSQGVCEQLQGDQLELNKELWLIQRSMQLAGTVKVFLKNGSKVVKEHVNNEIGAIINYTGEPPTFMVPEPIHPVFFENTNRIIERMRNRVGVSQMSTAGKKPMGLNSGAAIREFEDVESDRHRSISRANDNLYLQIAMLDVCIANEMSEHGIDPVRVPGKSNFSTIDWKKDIKGTEADEFVMQCFPVSRLPRDPSGRLQTIQEYVQAGFLTPRQARHALDFPDIDSIESLANAQEDLLTKVLDDIIDEGKYAPPEPTDDLQMAQEMSIEYIQRYRLLGLEDEKLNLLRTFNSQVNTLLARAAQPPPGMGPPGTSPGVSQQAVPMPPPRSDLLPNTPAA